MTAPYTQQNYADWKYRFQKQSAVGGLLRYAKQTAGIEDEPPPPSLLGATPPFNPNAPDPRERVNQGLLAPSVAPEQEDPTHRHRKGLLGKVRHFFGGDSISQENYDLLEPDQRERLLNMSMLKQIGDGGESEVAANMVAMRDDKKKRDMTAQQEATARRIEAVAATMSPQDGAEYAARMKGIYGLPTAQAAIGAAVGLKEREFAPQAPRAPITKNTEDGIMQYNLATNQWEPMRDAEGRPMKAPPPQLPPNQYLPTVTPEGTPTYTAVPGRGTGAPVETGLVRSVPGGQSPQEIKVINNERTLAYDDAQLSLGSLIGPNGRIKDPPNSWDRIATQSDWLNWTASDEGQNYMGNTRKLIRSWVVLIEGKRMSDADARVNEMMRSFRPGDKSLTVDGKKQTLESMAGSIRALGKGGVMLPTTPGIPQETPAGGRTYTDPVTGRTYRIP